jgi:hypothetical protein
MATDIGIYEKQVGFAHSAADCYLLRRLLATIQQNVKLLA